MIKWGLKSAARATANRERRPVIWKVDRSRIGFVRITPVAATEPQPGSGVSSARAVLLWTSVAALSIAEVAMAAQRLDHELARRNRQSTPGPDEPPPPDVAGVADLLARVACGDDGAFAALYDRTTAQVFGLIYRMVGDTTQAEDVTAQMYRQLWQTAPCSDSATRDSAQTWLLAPAHRHAIDHLRAHRDPDHEAPRLLASAPLPACMDNLDTLSRQLILLVDYRGYTWLHRVHDRPRRPAHVLRQRSRGQRGPHRVPRNPQHPSDRLDRQPFRSAQTTNLSPILHGQHPLGPPWLG